MKDLADYTGSFIALYMTGSYANDIILKSTLTPAEDLVFADIQWFKFSSTCRDVKVRVLLLDQSSEFLITSNPACMIRESH